MKSLKGSIRLLIQKWKDAKNMTDFSSLSIIEKVHDEYPGQWPDLNQLQTSRALSALWIEEQFKPNRLLSRSPRSDRHVMYYIAGHHDSMLAVARPISILMEEESDMVSAKPWNEIALNTLPWRKEGLTHILEHKLKGAFRKWNIKTVQDIHSHALQITKLRAIGPGVILLINRVLKSYGVPPLKTKAQLK
jgi:hypothetical protein